MSSKLTSKWVVFGSCLLFFASGCVLYVLVMTRHFVDDEIEMADEGQKVDEGTAKWDLQNESKQNGNFVGGDEQQKDQKKEKEQSEVLLLEQSMANGNEISNPDSRVHYKKSPDGRMKATMDITLHYQRQKVVSAAKGQ
ncbi:hypothetical protein niasHT_015591 [Heterodera trifolii]|uniref:Uncharacterized protein n=1 Tax=Heterodera trifolii TaxID=157864 RepID=A0ABD2LDX1_9BILA